MNKNYYITTPIYYVNDKPHIGHAYTSIACDVLARFKRLDGYSVKFLTGTDEHGQKVEKAAKSQNKSPLEYANFISKDFKSLTKTLNLSNDDFIRTTEKRHILAAQSLWSKLYENKHIYLDKYSGWYALRDEAFYSEKEIINGKAPSGADVSWVEEESYFFDLSKWQDKLLEFYDKNPNFILPKSRMNEVKSFVKGGLRDLSVSRTSFEWGVKVPNNDKHIMYVWLDALTNYLSAIGYPDTLENEYVNFWPADIHMVGKDILRFHAVYWPAFLMAAELPLPKRIFAHGWWTNEGKKISKSEGNVIDPLEIISSYGLDQIRYFLLREVPFGSDGDFSKTALLARINGDLSNDLGNLCQRVISMIYKNCNGFIPRKYEKLNDRDIIFYNKSNVLYEKVKNEIDKQSFHEAIKLIWAFISDANKYVDEQAPWKLRKTDERRMNDVLWILADTIRKIAIIVQPFMPDSSTKILDQLSIDISERDFSYLDSKHAIKTNKINSPSPIFPRIEE